MRALAYLKKTFLENLREWKILVLTVTFAPCFVYLMYGYFEAAAPSYRVVVVNHDRPANGETSPAASGLIAAWRAVKHPDGRPVLLVREAPDVGPARTRLERREVDLVVEIPAGFSQTLDDFRRGDTSAAPRLANHADATNPRSSMAMAFSDYVAFSYAVAATHAALPLDVELRPVGSGRSPSDFDLYVPALLVLAIIMVMFTAAATLIKEVDKGTIRRLMLSRLRAAELLAAVSVNQVLIGLVALALTFLAALSVGYRPEGSLAAVLVVGAVATLGVVALSVLVAAFLKTIFELLTVGCFPFFILTFFSESMFPLPKITLFQLGGHVLYANDVLPTSLAVRALNRILNFGAGLDDVVFELGMTLALTAFYFAVGTWLFLRRHYRVR